MARSAQDWLDAYSESHQNPTNKLIHFICIPAIMVSLVGLLWSIPVPFSSPWINAGTAFLVFGIGYYLVLSPKYAMGMAVVCAGIVSAVVGLTHLGPPLWASSLGLFIVAWIFQFIGHKIEGQKPSFFEDLQFLMIGPMWELDHIYRKVGVR